MKREARERVNATFIRRTSTKYMSNEPEVEGQKKRTRQETHRLHSRARSYAGKDDNILFLALKSVDGIEIDLANDLSTESLFKRTTKRNNLLAIHGDDPDTEVEVHRRELLAKSIKQQHCDFHLSGVHV